MLGLKELLELLQGLVAEEDVVGGESVGMALRGATALPSGVKGRGSARHCGGKLRVVYRNAWSYVVVRTPGGVGFGERAQWPYLARFWQGGGRNDSMTFCK